MSTATNYHGVFSSFNALESSEPSLLIQNARNHATASTPIESNTTAQQISDTKSLSETQQSLASNLSISLGLKGHYGAYSGSINGTYDTSYQQSSKSFNSYQSITASYGNYYYSGTNADILSNLDTALVTELNLIGDFAKAKAFVDNYGTHLITKSGIGGQLFISVQANSSTSAKQSSIAVAVTAAYEGIAGGVSGTSSVLNTLKTTFSDYELSYSMKVIGGNPSQANSSLTAWEETVDKDSVYKIEESIEFWNIPNVAPGSAIILQQYVENVMLIRSLENPTTFIAQETFSTGTASASVSVSSGFKIVSGGAWLDENGPSILTSSYPNISGNSITSWTVEAQNCVSVPTANQVIKSFAIAIFDPFNLTTLTIDQSTNSDKQSGLTQIDQELTSGGILVGGGVQTINGGGQAKFIQDNIVNDPAHWLTAVHDYDFAATNVTVTAFAIGLHFVNPLVLDVSAPVYPVVSVTGENNSLMATTPSGQGIIGGGAALASIDAGAGNLFKQSYPSGKNSWSSFDTDLNGQGTTATAVARAIYLEAKFSDMNDQ